MTKIFNGILLEPEKLSCFYSNNLPLKKDSGEETLLVQYSDPCADSRADKSAVNVMHMRLHFE